jgi:hypothetical protein
LKASWSSGEETIDESDDDCLSQIRANTARIARTVVNTLGYGLAVRSVRPRFLVLLENSPAKSVHLGNARPSL